MDDSLPPSLPVPRRSSGLGCFAKGCLLTVLLVLLAFAGFAAFSWYLFKHGSAYFSQQPVAVRVLPATDEQYNAVLAKLQPFGEALNAGHAATLALSADDLNILIARLPQFAPLRGRAFAALANNQLITDLSVPLNRDAGPNNTLYLNGRATLDASYSSDDFVFILRRFEPLQGPAPAGLIGKLVGDENALRGFSQGITASFNRDFHEQVDKTPRTATLLRKLRTIIIRDNQIVLTAAEGQPAPPEAVATPAKPE